MSNILKGIRNVIIGVAFLAGLIGMVYIKSASFEWSFITGSIVGIGGIWQLWVIDVMFRKWEGSAQIFSVLVNGLAFFGGSIYLWFTMPFGWELVLWIGGLYLATVMSSGAMFALLACGPILLATDIAAVAQVWWTTSSFDLNQVWDIWITNQYPYWVEIYLSIIQPVITFFWFFSTPTPQKATATEAVEAPLDVPS